MATKDMSGELGHCLVVQHDRDGMVFFFREGPEQFEANEAERLADGLNPITIENLEQECCVKPGHYLVIPLPNP